MYVIIKFNFLSVEVLRKAQCIRKRERKRKKENDFYQTVDSIFVIMIINYLIMISLRPRYQFKTIVYDNLRGYAYINFVQKV